MAPSALQGDAAIVLSHLAPGAPSTAEFVRDVAHASEGRMYLEGGLVHAQPSGWRRRGAGKGKGKGKGRGKVGGRALRCGWHA